MEYTDELLETLTDTFMGFFGLAAPFVLLKILPVAQRNNLYPGEVAFLMQALDAAGVKVDTAVGVASLVELMTVLSAAKDVQDDLDGTIVTTNFGKLTEQ